MLHSLSFLNVTGGSPRDSGCDVRLPRDPFATGVKEVRSPITLARLVMEQSPHVMLTGVGAEAFAREHDVERVPNDFFYFDIRICF